MLESFLSNISDWVIYAPYIFFVLLLLAGMNIPISEDIILLTSGMIANRFLPDQTVKMFLFVFAGCWISAWEAYSIGRYFGPKLYTLRWTRNLVTEQRVLKLAHFYHRFGIYTFLVGRFVPGGVRNMLFMSSGLCKMPFSLFLLRDGVACLLSSSVLFSIGYAFGQNFELIIDFFKQYNKIVVLCLLILLALSACYYIFKKRKV